MADEPSSAYLVVEIHNRDPVELADLTLSLQAFARQYQRFSARNEIITLEQAKLYVSEVRSGSILATLVPYVAVAAPFVSSTKDVVDLSTNVLQFAGYLRNGFEWLLGRRAQSDAERQYTVTDIREISQILEATAKDHEGQFVVKSYDNSNIQLTINYNTIEANAIQNGASKELALRRTPDQSFYPKVLMYWHTASRATGKRTSDKAIIEAISERPLPVVIDDETVKQNMLSGQDNPFLVGFIVDVELITIQGRLRGYRVVKLYETVEDTPDDLDPDEMPPHC